LVCSKHWHEQGGEADLPARRANVGGVKSRDETSIQKQAYDDCEHVTVYEQFSPKGH